MVVVIVVVVVIVTPSHRQNSLETRSIHSTARSRNATSAACPDVRRERGVADDGEGVSTPRLRNVRSRCWSTRSGSASPPMYWELCCTPAGEWGAGTRGAQGRSGGGASQPSGFAAGSRPVRGGFVCGAAVTLDGFD